MQPHCLRHTELPQTSRLFRDYLYDYDRVSQWYGHAPLREDSYQAAASEVRFTAAQRTGIVQALRQQNGDTPALAKLAQESTVAVVTGQQVGLFGGPAYTIYKALTAAKLARDLNAQGTPAVAVFWLATEDHDFPEVDHCWLYDAERVPCKVSVAGLADTQQPVGWLPVGDYPLAQLRETLAGLPYAEEVTALVEQHYQGRLGESFRGLLQGLLAPYDLLYLDPLHPAIRALAVPFLKNAAAASVDLSQELIARNDELTGAGYHAQVHWEAQNALFFRLENGRRLPLRRQGGDYVIKDRRWTAAELADEAELLSPNALLRPVMQDFLLPTVAYIGGPAELAYMAQSEVLYRGLLGRMPVMNPRSGFTLFSHRTAKLMERYGLTLPELLPGEGAVRSLIAQRLVPQAVQERLGTTKDTMIALLARLRRELVEFDPTLASALDTSGAKIVYQIDKTGAKVGREVLRRDTRAGAEATLLSHQLAPHKTLQERVYSLLPFLAEHGLGLIDTVAEHVHLDCPDHILLPVA